METDSFDAEKNSIRDTCKAVDQEQDELEQYGTIRVSEIIRATSESSQIGKVVRSIEASRSSLNFTQIGKLGKVIEATAFSQNLAEIGRVGGSIKAFRSSLDFTQIGKLGKAIEATAFIHNSAAIGKFGRAIEASRSSLDFTQIGKLGRAMEASRSTLDFAQIRRIGKALEISAFSRNLVKIGELGKAIEASRSLLDFAQIGIHEKRIRSFGVDAYPALEGVSVETLMGELKGRIESLKEPSTYVEPPAKCVEAEGHATVSIILTGEARVERTNRQDLSSVPTWLLWCLLHLLAAPIYFIVNWEAARQAIVDLNARLPKTESFFETRSFIRTQLAGKPGDIRLVINSNVNLREGPSMKSEIILKLPKNSPVAVVGKEDRTWILVSYEHQGYVISGFVSTKMLKKIRNTNDHANTL